MMHLIGAFERVYKDGANQKIIACLNSIPSCSIRSWNFSLNYLHLLRGSKRRFDYAIASHGDVDAPEEQQEAHIRA